MNATKYVQMYLAEVGAALYSKVRVTDVRLVMHTLGQCSTLIA
jgi:hypothetical protein